MADPSELEALARRYLDLWQDHLVAAASDPEVIATLTRLMTRAGAGLETQAALWREAWTMPSAPDGKAGQAEPAQTSAADPAAGSAAAANPPVDGCRDLAEFTLRLAALEKRLARLEAGGGRPRSPARRRPRRNPAS